MSNYRGNKKGPVFNSFAKEQKEEDAALDRLNNHMTYGIYWAVHRELGFGAKRLLRLYEGLKQTSNAWKLDKVSTEELLVYCKKKGIDVYGWVKSLSDGEKKNILYDFTGSRIRPGRLQLIEMAIVMHTSIMVVVLKEEFKMSNKKVEEVLATLKETIHCYTKVEPSTKKRYLSDEDIIETMKEEIGLDLVTGNMVRRCRKNVE